MESNGGFLRPNNVIPLQPDRSLQQHLSAPMDIISREQRSKVMAAIRSRNTRPEMRVRKLVFSLGYRFRLHVNKLPGSPDLVFPSRRKVIFVNGCFWHQHHCRLGKKMPKSRRTYWKPKLERNRLRDSRSRKSLRKLGWRVLTIWECQTSEKKLSNLAPKISSFLGQ